MPGGKHSKKRSQSGKRGGRSQSRAGAQVAGGQTRGGTGLAFGAGTRATHDTEAIDDDGPGDEDTEATSIEKSATGGQSRYQTRGATRRSEIAAGREREHSVDRHRRCG